MVVRVKGRPLFTRPAAVWHHLQRLRQYHSERWARQQQQRVARQQHKQRRAHGKPAASPGDSLGQPERCPGKGEANKTAGVYASDFYAGPIIPQGARRGPQYQVVEPKDGPMPNARAALFSPPQRCAKARRPEQHPRLPRLWVCATQKHRQCATCAAVGRGVRHCCARGHVGHPRPPCVGAQSTAWGAGQSEGGGAAHTGGGGGGAQRRGPSDASGGQCKEARPPREDGGTLTPPPPQSGRE